MKRTQLAQLLQGMQLEVSVPDSIALKAEKGGLVIVYAVGDDRIELRGAIRATAHRFEGGEVHFDVQGVLPLYDDIDATDEAEARGYFDRKRMAAELEAKWSGGRTADEPYRWVFKTAIPHSTFDMWDEMTPYCKGIVFSLADAGLHVDD